MVLFEQTGSLPSEIWHAKLVAITCALPVRRTIRLRAVNISHMFEAYQSRSFTPIYSAEAGRALADASYQAT